ncbi:MAG: hypothetical protein PVH31_10325 [Ectothiorhodospiraceae bacterium]|jgi:hypothetical protein
MVLILGTLLIALSILTLRLGIRAAVLPGSEGWPEWVVFNIAAPGIAAALAIGTGLGIQYFMSTPTLVDEILTVGAAGAIAVATILGWRLLRLPRATTPEAPVRGPVVHSIRAAGNGGKRAA